MARKKKVEMKVEQVQPEVVPVRGRPKGDASSRESNVHIRGTLAWVEWLKGYAKWRRLDMSSLMDQLACDDAKQRGYKKQPPDRLGNPKPKD